MKKTIIQRIKELGERVSKYEDVLCLLGLGSIADSSRIDDYSDIDFFLIVEEGTKDKFMNDLEWLKVIPLVFEFRNTRDGYKAMYEDGIFVEFAIFEPHEMSKVGYDTGVVVYKKDGFDEELAEARNLPKKRTIDVDFTVNECLTNIYVGVLREKRGEHASAFTFIQVYAANMIMLLFDDLYERRSESIDPYVFERRIESRYNEAQSILSKIKPGYDNNLEAAKNSLEFLNNNYKINMGLLNKIKSLL